MQIGYLSKQNLIRSNKVNEYALSKAVKNGIKEVILFKLQHWLLAKIEEN